jgi:cobalt-zinc-cadmium efflux system protein
MTNQTRDISEDNHDHGHENHDDHHAHAGHDHAGHGHSHAPKDFGKAFLIGVLLNAGFVTVED